jgi:hypothetical protein
VLGPRGIGLTAGLALMLAAPGCGGGDDNDGDDERSVRAAYAQLQGRFEARDAKGVCARISVAAKEQVGSLGHATPTTCAKDVKQLFKWIKPAAAKRASRPRAMRVALDGEKATVTAGLTENATGRVRFVEEDGQWKLDSFFSITGPPAPDML